MEIREDPVTTTPDFKESGLSSMLMTELRCPRLPSYGYDDAAETCTAVIARRASERVSDNGHFARRQFTGKERDSETGLDYFGARYYGSALGRFTSPDPIGIIKQKLFDPQQWNAYDYARNNPLRFMDPTGQYVTNCASDDKKCNKAADQFETQRQKDLNSKNKNVRAAAAAFGDQGADNGVHVGFADLGSQGLKGEVDISKSGNGKTDVEVTLERAKKPVVRPPFALLRFVVVVAGISDTSDGTLHL